MKGNDGGLLNDLMLMENTKKQDECARRAKMAQISRCDAGMSVRLEGSDD
jgi:hypothetical protein